MMGMVSKVLRSTEGGFMHWCPACNSFHMIAVSEPFPNGARWKFDGDLDKPTFAPSVRVRGGNAKGPTCCHYILTTGVINFCGDCTHAMAGKAVPLPEIPEQYRSE
jgi:hypothetical protein